MKVEQFKGLNHFHIYSDNVDELQSYKSLVVVIKDKKITLGKDWDYSRTTLRYVYMFLEEYGGINFDGIVDKRKFINQLIEEEKIVYDEEMK